MQDPVIVVAYDPRWPSEFQAERARIESRMQALDVVIEHIGSTAVPGLAAKPVLDLMIGLPRLHEARPWIEALVELGYEYVPAFESVMPERRYFRRFQDGVRTHQIHLVELGSAFWIRHLAFRDYLRACPEQAAAYAALKIDLARRFQHDREAYMDGKDAFIKQLEARALRGSHA